MTASNPAVSAISIEQRLVTGLLVLGLGFFMLIGVGFAGSTALHNAAHDTRHSIGFPCH